MPRHRALFGLACSLLLSAIALHAQSSTQSALESLRATFFALLTLLCALSAAAQTPPCAPPHPGQDGWTVSYTAGCMDASGHFAGGSQIIHLVAHKGQLYAAAGYWEDSHNFRYGGKDPNLGWGQILQLPAPDAPWHVDLDMGPRHMRPELLASVTFTQDAAGHPLPKPDTLLIAAAIDSAGRNGIHVWVRDDANGTWTRTDAVAGAAIPPGEDCSVRAARIYRDRVTGREHLFLSVGTVGLFTADYDPSRPGRLAWSAKPEFVPSGTRILGIAEANGSLFVSDGSHVVRRVDGPAPRYDMVADMTSQMDPGMDAKTFSAIGGIRGLTAVAAPTGTQQSLIFMWHPGRTSRGCILRLDLGAGGQYTQHTEVCLAQLASAHIGAPAAFILGAYSNFLPVTDPTTGEHLHIIGLETTLRTPAGQKLVAHNQHRAQGGTYAGAMYAVRDAKGSWRIGEVNGKFEPGKPELVSAYTYILSPFGGADAGRIYFGGYDCNDFPSTDTAWVYRADLKHVLALPSP